MAERLTYFCVKPKGVFPVLLLVFPQAVGMLAHVAVVVAAVASDFFSDEMGYFERFVFASEFYFSHNQPIVFAFEDIYLPGVTPILRGNEPSSLAYDARFADAHERFGFVQRFLPCLFLK